MGDPAEIWRVFTAEKMKIEKISIPVDFDLSFLKIRWSDRVVVKDGNKIAGEGVVYGGDWEKAEKLARQMAEMKFGAERDGLAVCEQVFILGKKEEGRRKKEIQDIISRGFNLKLKVGRDVIEDIKVIKFIRKDLKFSNQIRIDANQGYSLKQLLYLIPTLKEFGIKYVEEPVKVKDLPVAAELLHRYGLRIILDESLNLISIIKFIKFVDVINIKLSRIGDIQEALQLIKLAKKHNIKVVIGCSEELERGMVAIYALGHQARKAGVLLEVEGFGPLRLSASRRIAQAFGSEAQARRGKPPSIPRWINRLENLSLMFRHKFRQTAFDLWWELARISVLVLKQSKKLSALSLRLVELTGKYPGRVHPKHLVITDEEPEYLKWIKSTDAVLDIGCGNGQHSLKAAKKAASVVGFDIDESQLKLAKKAADRLRMKNVKFIADSAIEKLRFESSTFNNVLFLGVLEHLNDRNKVLQEVWRVLKTGGRLLLGVPNEMTSWKKTQMRFGIPHYTDPDHKVEFTGESISRLLENHKFKVIKLNPTAYDTPWAGIIDVIGGISLDWYRKLLEWKWDMVNRFPEETISYFIVANKVK